MVKIRRFILFVYAVAVLAVVPMLVSAFWYDFLWIPLLACIGYVVLPVMMSAIEIVFRGNSDLNAWFWSGRQPWPKQK